MSEKNREYLDWVKKLMTKYNLHTTHEGDRVKQVNIYFKSDVVVEITDDRELWYGLKLKEVDETERVLV